MAFESLYDNFIAEYYDLSPIVTGRKDIDFYVSAAKEFGERCWNWAAARGG
jgi:hypothetical protein